MREVPTVVSNDKDIEVAAVQFRQGFFNRGDWYVTWRQRERPWETAVMRLPLSQISGRARLRQRQFEYRVHWRWQELNASAGTAEAAGVG